MKRLEYVDAKEKIQSILSGDEYQAYHRPAGLLDQLKAWIKNVLESLLPHLHISDTTSAIVLYSMIGLLTIVLITIIIWILTRFRKSQRLKYRPVGTAGELAMSVSHHLEKARAAEALGDTITAVRFLFLALVRKLDETGWIQARSWKTNLEYDEEILKKDHDLAQEFKQIAQLFDQTIYGGQAPDHESYIRYQQTITDLIERMKTPLKEEGSLS